jgi:hypothetical protein
MNPLSYFRWYRRARGGFWSQVTSPLNPFSRIRWLRVESNPAPCAEWTYYPWGTRTMGNGYIDEWYADTEWSACPLSHALNRTVGTDDPEKIKKLVEAKK